MLRLAVEARLPLIRVETDDPVHISKVLTEIASTPVAYGTLIPTKIEPNSVTFVHGTEGIDWGLQYQIYAKKPATLIVVGGPRHAAFFDAGFVTAPKALIHDFVMKYANVEEVKKITDALSGLSYKQAIEISEMAMADKGEYSARAVQGIRRRFFGTVRGLELVNTDVPLYQPHVDLASWILKEGPFAFGDCQEILRPRGLLFDGPSGTGKTTGAKFLARELQQPLYRLDIGIVMSKWAGESEKNLQAALRQAENCSPCVILFDEIEKLFMGAEEGGVNTRLLASLLWWLQEHKARVFTTMTTNKSSLVPPELIRPGRIDKMLLFETMESEKAEKFYHTLCNQLHIEYGLPYPPNTKFLGGGWSHAEVTGRVLEAIKASLLDKGKSTG